MASEKDLFKFFTQCPNLILYGLPHLGIQEKWALVTLMGLCWDRTKQGLTLKELEGPYNLSLRQVSHITGIASSCLRNSKGKKPRIGVLEELQIAGYLTIVDAKPINEITKTLGRMQTYLYIHLEKLWDENQDFADRHRIPSRLIKEDSLMLVVDGEVVPMPAKTKIEKPARIGNNLHKREPRTKPIPTNSVRIAELQAMPYSDYLKTPEWQKKRIKALRFAQYRCQLCNDTGSLNVHHRTYERLGHEQMGDLITLCNDCHSIFHQNKELAE